MSHKVEVVRQTVLITPVQGTPVEAVFFLRPVGSSHESLGDRLNEAGLRFVPVEIEGRAEMLQLSWIAFLETWEPLPEVAELHALGASSEPVMVTLVNGNTLEGNLVYLAPPERQRISDRLNADPARFLLLASAKRTRYIQVSAISRIRPLDFPIEG